MQVSLPKSTAYYQVTKVQSKFGLFLDSSQEIISTYSSYPELFFFLLPSIPSQYHHHKQLHINIVVQLKNHNLILISQKRQCNSQDWTLQVVTVTLVKETLQLPEFPVDCVSSFDRYVLNTFRNSNTLQKQCASK